MDNNRQLRPIDQNRQDQLLTEGAIRAMESLVDRLGDIYIRGKELENKRLEIETLQLEIVEYYETERTRLLETFKAKKDLRIGLERMLEGAIQDSNHEMKLVLLDIYKEYIASLSSESSVKQFQSRGTSNSTDRIIEI